MFEVHVLNDAGIEKAQLIQYMFVEFAHEIDNLLKEVPSRERSIALTKLEEASFYVKRAMAQQEGNYTEIKNPKFAP